MKQIYINNVNGSVKDMDTEKDIKGNITGYAGKLEIGFLTSGDFSNMTEKEVLQFVAKALIGLKI